MTSSNQLAKHLREVFVGPNWTGVNFKDTIAGVGWHQAVTKIYDLNTIAALVYHITYYISANLRVLRGQGLDASDKLSFNLPPVTSEEDWQKLVTRAFTEAEAFASEVDKLDDSKLFDDFADPKYGNNYRNILGVSEHTHYHLGQIVLIKKVLNAPSSARS